MINGADFFVLLFEKHAQVKTIFNFSRNFTLLTYIGHFILAVQLPQGQQKLHVQFSLNYGNVPNQKIKNRPLNSQN